MDDSSFYNVTVFNLSTVYFYYFYFCYSTDLAYVSELLSVSFSAYFFYSQICT